MAKTVDTIERSKRLVEDREAKGWKQKKLIAATGIDRSTVSKHENGTAIAWDKAVAYANALGTDPHRYSEVVSPSLLASVEALERHVKVLALHVLPAGMADPPSAAQADELRRWLLAGLPPHEETG